MSQPEAVKRENKLIVNSKLIVKFPTSAPLWVLRTWLCSGRLKHLSPLESAHNQPR